MKEEEVRTLISMEMESLEDRVIRSEENDMKIMEELNATADSISALLAKVSKESSPDLGSESLTVTCAKTEKRWYLKRGQLENCHLSKDNILIAEFASGRGILRVRLMIQESLKNHRRLMDQLAFLLLKKKVKILPTTWTVDKAKGQSVRIHAEVEQIA